MPVNENFCAQYRELLERMKALAEFDGDVFLPNPPPKEPVDYILVCMEPSLGWWAKSADEARARVDAGFRNFLFSPEDFILHFCAQRFLCGTGQRYFLTDLSKGAMLVSRAGVARIERYDRWYALLQEEIELCSTPAARIVAVGNAVAQQLLRRGFKRPFTRVIHYSSQAGPARRAGIVGHEASFQSFNGSVSSEDIIVSAAATLEASGAPSEFRDETLARLTKSQLTISRQQLIFNYKMAFESMRS